MKLPETLTFEDLPGGVGAGARCFFRTIGHRAPKKGEWFVSGAIPRAYRARGDLTSEYYVVVPTHYANPASGYVRGVPVPQTTQNEFDLKESANGKT